MKKLLLFTFLFATANCRLFAQNNCMETGMNLRGFNLWQREYEQAMVDVMKSCLLWSTQNNNSTSPGNTNVLTSISLDADGYPLSLPVTVAGQTQPQVVATTMLNNINGQYPSGEYVMLYDGTGTFQLGGDAAVTSTTPGRVAFNVATPSNAGIFLKILTSSAADHVRNIRVLMPGTEFTYQTQPFNQAFLDKIAPFSVLRFTSWTFTNGNDLVTWESRRKPSYYTQGTYATSSPHAGCAYEHIIQLGNITQKDIWINVPAQADTNYIREMAIFFRDSLNTNSKIYLEYSNELWNPVMWFEQNWVNTNGPASLPNLAQKYAYFADRVFDIWASVFGASFSNRVVRVAACQNGNPWVGQQVMNYLSANGGADALSPAAYIDLRPYYYDSLDILGAGATPADVIRLTRKSFAELKTVFAGNKATANTYNLPLIYYEGGQHLVPEGGMAHPYNQAMFDAQIDTAMYNVYHELLSPNFSVY
ncbi:hypothetical protein C7N43_06045 [Sphingobacteriales bacterium UPWRP_1]|nr:hypothetical protein BVG80_11725 [Sphingobacteriales bacterium TSM_CSM]PSJ77896.1 hypothetical protein C7N43_06045 [Sphingobacteriales bacterium UPWRP_1]